MIIDFHTHIFPDAIAKSSLEKILESTPEMIPCTNGTVSGLLDSMLKNDIAKAVTLPVATKPGQVPTINGNAAKNVLDKIIAFGSLHPQSKSVEDEIEFLVKSGIKGVKLHPEYQSFIVDDRAMFPIYEILRDSKMFVVLHMGHDPYPLSKGRGTPMMLKNVLENFPGIKLVAAHMGGLRMWDSVENTILGDDIYFDTAAIFNSMPVELFIKFVKKQGSDKILFGTDSPWFDQKAGIDFIDSATLSTSDKENIFSANICSLLGIH